MIDINESFNFNKIENVLKKEGFRLSTSSVSTYYRKETFFIEEILFFSGPHNRIEEYIPVKIFFCIGVSLPPIHKTFDNINVQFHIEWDLIDIDYNGAKYMNFETIVDHVGREKILSFERTLKRIVNSPPDILQDSILTTAVISYTDEESLFKRCINNTNKIFREFHRILGFIKSDRTSTGRKRL